MRDIRASAEVVALIGTESLRELEKDAFRSYDCSECGSPGLTSDPASVVVHRYRRTAMVKLAHARCTPSKIVEFDAAGACIVLVGTIGLYAIPDDELTAARVHRMLDEAARAGSLAGGLIACPRDDPSGSGQVLPAELASNIRRFWGTPES